MSAKKHIQTAEKPPQPERPAARGSADESGEVKEFVENYLTLADKALGFMRRSGGNQLTISTCRFCQHTIASTNLRLLAFAENLHQCPAKRSQPPAGNVAA